MSLSLVLTVIGDDRPGLVEQIATAISENKGNWLESSMSNLAENLPGSFAAASPIRSSIQGPAPALPMPRGLRRPASRGSRRCRARPCC